MGFISDEIIEAVRLRSDIVEVISRHVQLKRKGRYYTGLCPFHQERTPSFTVMPDKQIFYCFGCNNGGDVFKFLMLKDNLTFLEAVRLLARQAGVSIPETRSPAELAKQQKTKLLKQVNGLARDFFCSVLREHNVAAPAREYLAGRGIDAAIVERFQIGYAPPGWDHLLDFMKSHKIKPQLVAEAGLAQMKESGKCYDRFRGRVIFPIWDITGQVIAFGGRVLDEMLPKYLNSPETDVFIKGRNLYGLHLAGKAARDKGSLVIMEGYMDVVTAHSMGITNAVASLGTNLTREQGYLLLNHSKDIVLAYDADEAGMKAALRSLEMLQEIGCHARIVRIPEGKDPDDFLRSRGAEAWEGLIEGASSVIEYVLQRSTEKKPAVTITDKLNVTQGAFPYIARMKTEVEREESLKTVSRALSLSPEAVRAEFVKYTGTTRRNQFGANSIDKRSVAVKPITGGSRGNSREKAEEGLIRLIIEDPSYGEILIKELGNTPFRNEAFNKIFSQILAVAEQPDYKPAKLMTNLEENEQVILSRMLASDVSLEKPEQWVSDYINVIKREDRRERRETILQEIGAAEKLGDQALYGNLWREFVLLRGIAEAERTGDPVQAENLLDEYRRHREGSESAERRN